MSKMSANNKGTIFAAIKMLEQLYKNGHIPSYVLRNVIDEYAEQIDTSSFPCYESIGLKKNSNLRPCFNRTRSTVVCVGQSDRLVQVHLKRSS